MAYAYGNAWERERERLGGLEALWDPGTLRILDRLGVREGWRCLEVGGGGGSVAAWLCERAGARGRVLATDIDTRFLEAIGHPALEVRTHDIGADDLEAGAFDLVHARLVLEHVGAREAALKRLAAALAPGGWLLVEDFDWTPQLALPASKTFARPAGAARTMARATRAVLGLMERTAGYDPAYGRDLPARLEAVGLAGVDAEGRSLLVRGGSPFAAFYRLSLERMRDALEATGAMRAGEIDRALGLLADPATLLSSPTLVAAWGRSPA